ncbi:MAG TPA: C39 family peptidase [Sphingomicrobium sp.]|nr:C39 family peptidase [Sphingomicrobium sp.]
MSSLARHARSALLAVTVLMAAWPQGANAQVRLTNGDAGGNYTVSVMSWWQIPFRTVVHQQYDFSCGSAAVATLLTYHYNRPTPERLPFTQMWKDGDQKTIRKVGFSMFDMKTYLDSIGLHTEGYRLGAAGLAKLKRPAIVLLDIKGFKHFVVVKGVRGDRVLVGDPMLGLNEYSRADFLKLWNGIALAVADSKTAKFNLASDWGPWSRAPMEDAGLHVAGDDFLRTLPSTYQLTPQILLAVNVGTVQ